MTNPDNIVRVRARNGGRASVYEANGWAQAYTSGLLEGTGVIQNTVADMNVLVGGSSAKPDVVLAENAAGYRIALDIVGQQAVAITAPASNSRISAIVAYTDDLSLATTEDTVTGSPSSCGLIVVNGTAAVNPTEPTDNQIRTAITADGATGSQAAYCVIATILVANDTTAITNTLITTNAAKLAGTGVVSSSNIDFTTLGYSKGVTIQIGSMANDSSDNDHFTVCGMYTASRTKIVFSIPLPKSLINISNITVTDSRLFIRHPIGGYLVNGGTILQTGVTVVVGKITDNLITVVAEKTSIWDSNVPNNVPLSVSGGIELSLS